MGKSNKITRHHIYPKSRLDRKYIPNNVVKVRHIQHDLYHQLFSNKTPVEILEYLVNDFWGGQVEYVKEYLKSK